MKQKFSILGRTKKGSPKMILQNPKLFNDQICEMEGNIMLTVEIIEDKGTNLQIWHFRKVVVPLVVKLSMKDGNLLRESEAELLLLHQVCNLPEDKELEDFTKSEMSTIIDHSKRWINEFFNNLSETGKKII